MSTTTSKTPVRMLGDDDDFKENECDDNGREFVLFSRSYKHKIPRTEEFITVDGTWLDKHVLETIKKHNNGKFTPSPSISKSGSIGTIHFRVSTKATGFLKEMAVKSGKGGLVKVHHAVRRSQGLDKGVVYGIRSKDCNIHHVSEKPWENWLENLDLVRANQNSSFKRKGDQGISKSKNGKTWQFNVFSHSIVQGYIVQVFEKKPDTRIHSELVYRYIEMSEKCKFPTEETSNARSKPRSEEWVEAYRGALTHLAIDFLVKHTGYFQNDKTLGEIRAIYKKPEECPFKDKVLTKKYIRKKIKEMHAKTKTENENENKNKNKRRTNSVANYFGPVQSSKRAR